MPPPIKHFEPGTEIGSLRIICPSTNELGKRGQMCDCLLCGKRVFKTNSYLMQAGIKQGYNISCGCSRKNRTRYLWRDMYLYLVWRLDL